MLTHDQGLAVLVTASSSRHLHLAYLRPERGGRLAVLVTASSSRQQRDRALLGRLLVSRRPRDGEFIEAYLGDRTAPQRQSGLAVLVTASSSRRK